MMHSATDYDELPYAGGAYWFTHPDHLSLLGGLAGLATAPSATCSVLEIGCGDGGNLLSMAACLPNARFVGIDLSAVHIERGTTLAALAQLDNVTLLHADLQTYSPPERFDFVIAHGVYSWVPKDVRDALMRLIATALAPTGVALVSYNALPGHAPFQAIRGLMRMHTEGLVDPQAKLEAARRIAAEWVAFNDADPRHGPTARRVARELERSPPFLVRHDHLAEFESPILFGDFVSHARQFGLDFLDNALPGSHRIETLDPELRTMLGQVPDRVRAQQYLDFFEDTRFRVTLLARTDAIRLVPLSLKDMYLELRQDIEASAVKVLPRVVLETGSGQVEVDDLATRLAIGVLTGEAPHPVALRTIRDRVLVRLTEEITPPPPPEILLEHLARTLEQLWRHDLVHLWRAPPMPASAGPHPSTGALQRVYAARGTDVPDLHHRAAKILEVDRGLLAALDGQSDMGALIARFGPDVLQRIERLRLRRLAR